MRASTLIILETRFGLKATAELYDANLSEPVQYEWGSSRLRNGRALVFFPEKVAHPHDGIDLFLSESRQQIPPN